MLELLTLMVCLGLFFQLGGIMENTVIVNEIERRMTNEPKPSAIGEHDSHS